MTRQVLILIACAAFAGSPPIAAQDTPYTANFSLYHVAGMPITLLSDEDVSDPAYSPIEGILDYPISRMAFEDSPLEEILRFVEDVYAVPIELDLDSASRNALLSAKKIAHVEVFATTFRNALGGLLNPLGLNYELTKDTIRIASLDASRPPVRGRVFVSSGKFETVEHGALRVGAFFARLGVRAESEPQPNGYCRLLAKYAVPLNRNDENQTTRIDLVNPKPLEYLEPISEQLSTYTIRRSDNTTGMTVVAKLEDDAHGITRVALDITAHYLSHREPLFKSSLSAGKPTIIGKIPGITHIPIGKQAAILTPLPEPHGGVFVLLVEVTNDPLKS